ncbi:MAG: DsbA family protein [Bacteroidaceae bacterium]|nr:DsbA family protein [Bacteroidaceae bacterium]
MKITIFADPVCTWCWGSVPVIRALAYRYGEQLKISYLMGGMIEDITTYSNRKLSIGGDIALSNRNIHEHWLEASSAHGMPVCNTSLHLFDEEHRSTLPQNYAYIAAHIYCKRHKDSTPKQSHFHFLRRLQEATATDGSKTNREEKIIGIASATGFDPELFREIFNSDEVKSEYKKNKDLCNEYDVQSFPTFIVEHQGEEILLRGFSTYETIAQTIAQLSFNNIKTINDGREILVKENVKHFISQYGSAYPVEIATAFSLKRNSGHTALNAESYELLPDIIEELIEDGEIAMAPKGNGFIYYCLKENETPRHEHNRRMAGIL